MNKIIVPTDFSDTARLATDVAAKLAKKGNATLVLYHAYHMPGTGRPVMIDLSDILKKDAIESLEKEKERLSGYEIEIELFCDYGPAVPLLTDLAAKLKPDLIVMGTVGASGTKEYFLGSNTSGLIGKTQTPILAIPAELNSAEIKEITFAWDLVDVDKKLVDSMKYLANILDISITVLHIDEGEKSELNEILLKEFVEDIDGATYVSIQDDNVQSALFDYVEENDAILSVIARKHGFLERLFRRSVSKSLTNHTKSPILILAS